MNIQEQLVYFFKFILAYISSLDIGKFYNSDTTTNENPYIPSICYDSTYQIPSRNCLGGWFYRVNKKTAEINAQFAKDHDWNYVLLSSNVYSKTGKNLLKNNTIAFRNKNIAVHLMCLEDVVYIDDPKTAYEEISGILQYVNENNLDIQGIHIDCEPHGRDDWKNASVEKRNEIFNNYLKVVEYGRQAINEFRPNTTYSGAVAWWYSSKAKSNELEFGRGYDLVNEKRFDFIFPMIYDGAGGTVNKVISRSEDYITDNANTVIGIAVEDYEYSKFKNVTEEIKNNRAMSPYFSGISIYANCYYPDWNNY